MEATVITIYVFMFTMLLFLIGVIIARWIFRINDIVRRLDDVISLLKVKD